MQVRQEKKDKLEKQRQMQRNAYMSTGSQREENENGRSSSSGIAIECGKLVYFVLS